MMTSIFNVLVLPVSLGVVLNQYLRILILPIQKFASPLSILLICFIVAIIVALNKTNLSAISLILVGLVLVHNIAGLGLGYLVTLVITRDKIISKTIAIEVGMQNSGLAAALAVKFFSVGSALPAAVFSVIHNVTGSLLASYWSNKPH